eukprot:gene6416-2566_t
MKNAAKGDTWHELQNLRGAKPSNAICALRGHVGMRLCMNHASTLEFIPGVGCANW